MTTLTTQVQIDANQDTVWKMLKTLSALRSQAGRSNPEHPHRRQRWHQPSHCRAQLRAQLKNVTWKQGQGFEVTLLESGPIQSGTLQLTLTSDQAQTVVTQTLNYELKPNAIAQVRGQWAQTSRRLSLQQRIEQHLEHHLHRLKTAAEVFSSETSQIPRALPEA